MSDDDVSYGRSDEMEKCPFCEGTFMPTRDAAGKADGLAHANPPCKTFMDLDPMAFVEAVNATLRAQALDPQAKRRGDA